MTAGGFLGDLSQAIVAMRLILDLLVAISFAAWSVIAAAVFLSARRRVKQIRSRRPAARRRY